MTFDPMFRIRKFISLNSSKFIGLYKSSNLFIQNQPPTLNKIFWFKQIASVQKSEHSNLFFLILGLTKFNIKGPFGARQIFEQSANRFPKGL